MQSCEQDRSNYFRIIRFVFVMAKGYWISTGTIHTPLAMVPYISRLTEWLTTVSA